MLYAWCVVTLMCCLSGVQLRKLISQISVEWRSVCFAAGFSCFGSLLVGVRLRESISPVAVERRSVLRCGWVFTALAACLLVYD